MAEDRRCDGEKVRDVTLKEELEILRGEPIEVFDGDPMDIPCIETSDAEKLCRHPVVSVHMITYNHEPYIRQAIEGVMMQQTDFEFELVIGEDASQDKTREICFEYQKKYPDKIRVLWWHENVSKFGGNDRRVTARCRGEFIAFCEGDDFWTDPLKLQKQVDVMLMQPHVGLCFTGASLFRQSDRCFIDWNCMHVADGEMAGEDFLKALCFGKQEGGHGFELAVFTATTLCRSRYLSDAIRGFDVFKWSIPIGDTQIWAALASVSDVYYVNDTTAVYRIHSGGICSYNHLNVVMAGFIVRFYFAVKGLGFSYNDTVKKMSSIYFDTYTRAVSNMERARQRQISKQFFKSPKRRRMWGICRRFPLYLLLRMGLCRSRFYVWWKIAERCFSL